jgi:hypothetical protein
LEWKSLSLTTDTPLSAFDWQTRSAFLELYSIKWVSVVNVADASVEGIEGEVRLVCMDSRYVYLGMYNNESSTYANYLLGRNQACKHYLQSSHIDLLLTKHVRPRMLKSVIW